MLSQPTFDMMLSVTMVVIVALAWGGIVLVRKRNDRGRGWLMIVAAIILLGNVLIWTWPT